MVTGRNRSIGFRLESGSSVSENERYAPLMGFMVERG